MVRSQGLMCKLVAQSVLLYGIKIWVVTGYMINVLEGFHHQLAQKITGIPEKRGAGGEWRYP